MKLQISVLRNENFPDPKCHLLGNHAVIMRLWKELCRDVIDEIQQPAQTGIEINFHFHQSNSFYDNVLEFCGVCA